MDYSASGGIGKEGLSIVDSEAGRKITAHSFSYSSFNSINVIQSQPLMRAEPITITKCSLKLNLGCKVCVDSSIIISKKYVKADERKDKWK